MLEVVDSVEVEAVVFEGSESNVVSIEVVFVEVECRSRASVEIFESLSMNIYHNGGNDIEQDYLCLDQV